MEEKGNKFEFSYSAPTEEERKIIESIRKEYLPKSKNTDAFSKLKILDGKVKNFPKALGISLGIIGTLIFGLGLSLVLEFQKVFLGIIIAAVGLLPITAAYPVFKKLYEKNKHKYGEEILQLSEELLKENEE